MDMPKATALPMEERPGNPLLTIMSGSLEYPGQKLSGKNGGDTNG